MELQKKLNNFYKIINQEALEQKRAAFNSNIEKINSEFENEFTRMINKSLEKISERESQCERDLRKTESNQISEHKKKIILKREEIKEKLFQDLEKKLREFVKTSEYIKQILAQIKKINFRCVVEISRKDYKLLEAINNFKSNRCVIFKICDEDFIGGYKIYFKDKKAMIDNSFASRIKLEKENFNKFKLPT